MISSNRRPTRHLLMPIFALALAACGGGGRDDGSSNPQQAQTAPFDQVDWGTEAFSIHMLAVAGGWNSNKGDTGNSVLSSTFGLSIYHSGQDANDLSSIGLVRTTGGMEATWTPDIGAPIFTSKDGAAWEAEGVYHPSVLRRGADILMYYTGKDAKGVFRIGRARSTDGIQFKRDSSVPSVELGAPGAWDSGGVDQPSVIHDGHRFVMLYRGWSSNPGFTDTHSQIGLATSDDGSAWTKSSSNPILRWGSVDAWDEHGLLAPRLWLENGVYHVNFSAKSNGVTTRSASSIGHATATSLSAWTKSPRNPILSSANTHWHELEWATPYREGNCLYILTTAWVETGSTVVWRNCTP